MDRRVIDGDDVSNAPETVYRSIIGLEVHIQLKTATKLFCACPVTFGAEPNTAICPICSGQPGTLPQLNRHAVILASRLALALGSEIGAPSHFERKSYFYPDLPKGFQITQHDRPFARGGSVPLRDARVIRIHELHLEEDAGKSLHRGGTSLIDLNRAGVPLVEIVTEPALIDTEEAIVFVKTIRQLVRYLDVSEAHLAHGSLRCDVNLSLRHRRTHEETARQEIKNLNSFRFVRKAIAYEIDRIVTALDRGETIVSETRCWDEPTRMTWPMRHKEVPTDYGYTVEPDLPPLRLNETWLVPVREALPELPWQRAERFCQQYQLTREDAERVTAERALADYFEATVKFGVQPRRVVRWLLREVLTDASGDDLFANVSVEPERLCELLNYVDEETISDASAKIVWETMLHDRRSVAEIATEKNCFLRKDQESWIAERCKKLFDEYPQHVDEYRRGKTKLLSFFVGESLRGANGSVDGSIEPKRVAFVLKKMLDEIAPLSAKE